MSEATRTAESKKELYRQEIENLRATVKVLEDQVAALLDVKARVSLRLDHVTVL